MDIGLAIKKNIFYSDTAMTLDARFTQLRRGESLYQDAVGGAGAAPSRTSRADTMSAASVRNRRLAIQMSRRPAVVAALNRNLPRIIPNGVLNRLGHTGALSNLQEIGTFRSNAAFGTPNRRRSNSATRLRGSGINRGSGGFRRGSGRRGGGRGGVNRASRPRVRSNSVSRIQRSGSLGPMSRAGSLGNLSRSGSMNRLTRSQSVQSLSGWANNVFRGRGFGRGRRRGRGRIGGVIQGFVTRRKPNFNVGNFRGRGGRNRGAQPVTNSNNSRNFRGGRYNGGGFRFRGGGNRRGTGARGGGGFRGSRGARGRGGNNRLPRQKEQVPTKEALDMEIDEYMSTTRSHLDKEIETYMNQPVEEGTGATANQQNGSITETWD